MGFYFKMSHLEDITNDEISRRKFLALALAGAVGLTGCRRKRRRPVDNQRPGMPDTNPGPTPQQDFHHFSGTVKDTDNNLVQGARVKLRVMNHVKTYEAVSD